MVLYHTCMLPQNIIIILHNMLGYNVDNSASRSEETPGRLLLYLAAGTYYGLGMRNKGRGIRCSTFSWSNTNSDPYKVHDHTLSFEG